MTLPKDLVAASATPIILAILQKEDTYGYAIIRKVQEISDNQIAWTDGMLYPVLHRLESAGFIDSYWRKAENGRRRKYYHITASGEEECGRLISQWSVVEKALQILLEETHT
ncbi:MAG: PadR family transcriptional regulator [Spirochaetia bacterium]|nr:PadR family transcriptional regulator [Spirochaetia bacterium]MCF7953131.1 PadR family transcriptional regulator [Spirochaetales bacterium]